MILHATVCTCTIVHACLCVHPTCMYDRLVHAMPVCVKDCIKPGLEYVVTNSSLQCLVQQTHSASPSPLWVGRPQL